MSDTQDDLWKRIWQNTRSAATLADITALRGLIEAERTQPQPDPRDLGWTYATPPPLTQPQPDTARLDCGECGARPGEFHGTNCRAPDMPMTDAEVEALRDSLSGPYANQTMRRLLATLDAIRSTPAAPRCTCGASGIEDIGVNHRDDCAIRSTPAAPKPDACPRCGAIEGRSEDCPDHGAY